MDRRQSKTIEVLQKALSMTDKEKQEIAEHGTMTDAELDAFDQRARETFEQTQRMTAELRQMREAAKPDEDPPPGSDEAKALIKDAIRQGHTTENE